MEARLLLIGIASFVGGLLVVSRAGAWVLLLRSISRASRSSPPPTSLLVFLWPSLLHSGPWLLALALAGIYYAATSSQLSNLWAILVGGFLAAAVTTLGVWRSRHRAPTVPLTPSRLLAIRRRFFWRNSLFFALVSSAFLAYGPLEGSRSQREILVFFGFIASFGGGWLWSWFMWQWYGAQLKVNEKARLARERANEV